MHEAALLNRLMRKIAAVAAEQGATRVTGLKLRLGALSHFTPEHFRTHFDVVARGTVAEGARLELTRMSDESDAEAEGVVLEHVELEL